VRFMADFETTTDVNDCRVWASCWVDIDQVYTENHGNTLQIHNSIKPFFDYFSNLEGEHHCYFHNLKFDGMFILDYLLRNGFTYDENLKKQKTFNTMITNEKIFYQIKIRFSDIKEKHYNVNNRNYKKKRCILVIKDSLKKIPLKVSQTAKAYNIEETKLEIDYTAKRGHDHILTNEERDYVANDVIIMAKAMNQMFHEGMERLTLSSDAMNDFKLKLAKGNEKHKEKVFRQYFPCLIQIADDYIRNAYKGGYTYTNPKYQGEVVGCGLVYDVNSLYPSRMQQCPLPYGVPKYFQGEYEFTPTHPLFIQHIKCSFMIKEGYLPTVQIKGSSRFSETEYLTECDSIQEFYFTSVDLKLFFEHYHVFDLEYIDGFMFRSRVGFFDEYINYWGHIKQTSTGGKRQLAKLMLNSLYGKFASSTSGTMKEPFLNEEGQMKFESVEHEEREPVYTALACFVTAWARDLMIRSAQSCYDRFLYCDTDSLHVLDFEVPNIDIHPDRIGAWKCEGVFSKAKYLRAKTYLETFYTIDGKMIECPSLVDNTNGEKTEVKCAGMPENVKSHVTYDNFKTGAVFGGKLMPKTVKGGVVLIEKDFTIKN